ncbi:hypothetical protein GCM10020295_35520 [Streptomyces cinereospinus]
MGYDPVHFWRGGPEDPGYHVIRIDPWRVQLVRGSDLRSTIWRPAAAGGDALPDAADGLARASRRP